MGLNCIDWFAFEKVQSMTASYDTTPCRPDVAICLWRMSFIGGEGQGVSSSHSLRHLQEEASLSVRICSMTMSSTWSWKMSREACMTPCTMLARSRVLKR